RLTHGELDGDLGEKAGDTLRRVVGGGLEAQPVGPGLKAAIIGQQRAQAPISVGRALAEQTPGAIVFAQEQGDRAARGRPTASGAEDVRRDSAHVDEPPSTPSSLPRRRRVILACSSAAVRSSAARSLPSRRSSRASISGALLPVAQTMKRNPN